MSHFDLTEKRYKIAELTQKSMEADFWNDAQKAQHTIRKCNSMKEIVDSYDALEKQIADLAESADLLKQENDDELLMLAEEEYKELTERFADFEIKVLLSHEYDQSNAILEIHPGAGGTESCDWADMLYRMYSRYANKKGFKVTTLDYQPGEEAGIKSVTLLVEGEKAYGYLKAEKGVHRLVRISPFDAGARRHTSFASLDVMPQFQDEIEIDIKPEDLIVETKRASGAGGQHSNKTSSAIRITHLPTGIVVQCQNERSQFQNKDKAMQMLKAKLYMLKKEANAEKLSDIRGEVKEIGWGNQIRSYVMQPYTMVKDHRTSAETGNVDAVMDGALDPFINAYLKWINTKEP